MIRYMRGTEGQLLICFSKQIKEKLRSIDEKRKKKKTINQRATD